MNEWQESVAEFESTVGLKPSPEIRMLDLTSEVGELSKEVLLGNSYGGHEFSVTKNWTEELGDCLYSLCSLANMTNVDLSIALKVALTKYRGRTAKSGNPGNG